MTDTTIVTQADRDAAARLNGYARYQTWQIAPMHDEHWMELCSKDFARHRIASTAELADALRDCAADLEAEIEAKRGTVLERTTERDLASVRSARLILAKVGGQHERH
jgi:hypothetical protein